MDNGGNETFVSKMTDEKTKQVTRNKEPSLERGTSSGEEGCSSSISSFEDFASA